MEATATVVASENGVAPVEATFDGVAEATRSNDELFQWSKFVHVGVGAAECEHGEDGECKDQAHFHSWVCLPNVFQIRDIGEKARAAKARKKRALLDPESDSYAIMEDELADFARDDMPRLVENVARSNVAKRVNDIVKELKEDERFENQEQDAEELRRQTALPEGERDKEEYERLQAQIVAYGERFDELLAEHQKREEESLRALPPEEVTELERRRRIEETSAEMFWHTYYTWAMYVGARQPVKSGFAIRRKFPAAEDLKAAPPEVVTALREAIAELEGATAVRSDAAGN
jgi:hypothetical protein